MEHQTLGWWDEYPIDPATQRITLKIVGFLMVVVLGHVACKEGPIEIRPDLATSLFYVL